MFEDFSEDKAKDDVRINDMMVMEMLKYELTEKEYVCINLITIHGWTAEAAARKYGISKQAVIYNIRIDRVNCSGYNVNGGWNENIA